METPGQASGPGWSGRLSLGLLLFGGTLLILSRGWLMWRWDSPIRELIWEEKWWTPVLARFEVTWGHFARTSDTWITPTLQRTGLFLIGAAAIPWLALWSRLRWTRWLLVPVVLILALDALARWVSKDLQAGMAMEYALRVFLPLAILVHLGKESALSAFRRRLVVSMLLLSVALTFVGHGLYAMGYYDIPLEFRIMTTEILPLSEEQSLVFLKAAGWLDFGVVALLLLPRTRMVALAYMFLWGGATSAARIWAYYEPTLPWNGLDPWLAEALVRTPHWLVPLWLILVMRSRERARKSTEGKAETAVA